MRPFLSLAVVGLFVLVASWQAPAEFDLEYACLHRALNPCLAAEEFAARVADRTHGRVQIEITSIPNSQLRFVDKFRRLQEGTWDLAEIARGDFAINRSIDGDDSILDMGDLWGLYSEYGIQAQVIEAIREDAQRLVEERTSGVVLALQYYPSQYFFAQKPLRTAADFQRLRIRSHNFVLYDMLVGIGASPQTLAFDLVNLAFERGKIDAAVSCSSCGAGLKWYEKTGYLVGPIPSLAYSWMVINGQRWAELPPDLQKIILEEAHRHEEVTRREALSIWQQQGVVENTEAGMEHIELTPELKELMRSAALLTVLPRWVQRAGGPESNTVKVFNQKVAPIVGIEITEEGKAREIQ